MKNGQNVNIKIEYGTESLKEILIELLKEQYINYNYEWKINACLRLTIIKKTRYNQDALNRLFTLKKFK